VFLLLVADIFYTVNLKRDEMKFPVLFFAILLTSPVITKASENTEAVYSYIKTYRDIAVEEMKRTGIPASIKLAQAINESGFGKSYLAKNGNNHFGIKCGGSWQGKTIYKKDDKYRRGRLQQSCFRKYENAEESFKAHSNFLTQKERYASLFKLSPTDYKSWAKGLQKAGYATSKTYAQKLISLIERYDLNQYDTTAPAEKEKGLRFTSRKVERKKRKDLIRYAQKLKGKRYKYGGKSKSGFDCSGFTYYVYGKQGIKLNASSKTQAKQGKKVKIRKAQPGDLVFFSHNGRSIGHVAMVTKNGKDGLWVIHSTTKRGVVEDNISKSKYWKPRLVMARTIIN
jgi:cell wall-associated NlpC family hydrolase